MTGHTVRGAIKLRRGREARARAGHPWVYAGEIEEVVGDPIGGDVVDVLSSSGAFIGRGYVNFKSQIAIRMLTWRDEPVDDQWFVRTLSKAVEHRRLIAPGCRAMRLVHSEGDGLPGLIVDAYDDCLVFQFLTLGMDLRRALLVPALMQLWGAKHAYERSDVRSREYEGLEQRAGFLSQPFDVNRSIVENGFRFMVDVERGQKTGHFLDQRENRASLAGYCEGRKVLDCFSYTGAFAVHAAGYGAARVTAVDISASALEQARRNAALNGFDDRVQLVEANVFDYLREKASSPEARGSYDMVILDPPAFTKTRHATESALRGYKEINLRAAHLLADGGILVTSSCSHHVDDYTFVQVVESALKDAGRRARALEHRGQGRDHPVLAGVPETSYLKFLVLQMV